MTTRPDARRAPGPPRPGAPAPLVGRPRRRPAAPASLAEVAAIDFDQLDDLIADARPAATSRPRPAADQVGPVEVDPPAPDRRRAGRPPARRRGRRRGPRRRRGRRRGRRRAARAPGSGSTARRGPIPIGPVSAASLFQIHAEKIVALGRRYGQPIPLYVMTSPENHEATVRFFDEHDRLRPRPRPVLRPGADAGRRPRDGQGPARREGPRRPQPRRPRRDARRPGRPRARRRRRAASTRCASGASGRSSTSRSTTRSSRSPTRPSSASTARPSAEMSFKVIEKVAPDEKLGVVVTVDGTPAGDRVFRPPRRAGRAPRARREPRALGREHRHPPLRAGVRRAAASGETAAPVPPGRSRRCPTSTTTGEPVKPDRAERGEVRAVHLRRPAAGRAVRPWSRPTARSSSSRSRTRPAPTRPATVRQRMSDQFADWLEAGRARRSRGGPTGRSRSGSRSARCSRSTPAELKAKIEPGLIVEGPLYLAVSRPFDAVDVPIPTRPIRDLKGFDRPCSTPS